MKNYLEYFENPPAEFRGRPFWAWNCKLEKEELLKQISYFKEMGMGGATIHCRTGLATEYMGKEFMDIITAAVMEAKKQGMLTGLYDEDRWPSGFAGGKVTEDFKYRKRFLVFSPWKKEYHEEGMKDVHSDKSFWERSAGNGTLIASYEVVLENGYLKSYRRLTGETADGAEKWTDKIAEETGAPGNEENNGMRWYAYLELAAPNPKFNGRTYVNTLDKEALQYFLETTHEKYKESLGEEFGGTIPSIFSDEPQFCFKQFFGAAEEKRELLIPYTDDFEQTFRETYGESFLDHLPEIFWELPKGGVSHVRYEYHEHITERFARAFADTIGDWCKKNHIAFTGHMMEEPTLYSQTSCIGEAMRNYRGFGIPGIDILCDKREYTTAKQAQSAVQQMGKSQMMCEIYGVTNWDFDFRGHKSEGDWLAALGVTERVHHLSWVSMAGESKRDYPASIFYQSPWYQEYGEIETYFSRINTALRSGKPKVRIGVIHPVESYWLIYGPQEQTAKRREMLEKQFKEITEWLLFGLLDFNYISEGLLEFLDDREMAPEESEETRKEGTAGHKEKEAEIRPENGFRAGKMLYDCIIVPGCLTLREHTVKRLQDFQNAGGMVLFMGDVPRYVAGRADERPGELAKQGMQIPFEYNKLLEALEPYRMLELRDKDGVRADSYLCQMREAANGQILFLANGKRTVKPDIPAAKDYILGIYGNYRVTELDALTGKRTEIPAWYQDGKTCIKKRFYEQDSLLLYLQHIEGQEDEKAQEEAKAQERVEQQEKKEPVRKIAAILNDIAGFLAKEENVLVLDQPEYALDSETYQPAEEMLRLDKKLRERVGYPLRTGISVQPWARQTEEPSPKLSAAQEGNHRLHLRYGIYAEAKAHDCKLVIEELANARVFWDGKEMDTTARGFFVDHQIPYMYLGTVLKGNHELVIEFPFKPQTKMEWSYLIGNFGVRVLGNRAILTDLPVKIGYGSLTDYGFPFYGGNFTYQHEITVAEEGDYEIEITKFRAPLLSVAVDGKPAGKIMFSPYRCSLGHLKPGKHTIYITAYGNRINTFGQIHNSDDNFDYYGPDSWRTEGAAYSYEYQLWKTGILSAPVVYKRIQ